MPFDLNMDDKKPTKICVSCKRRIPLSSQSEYCEACLDDMQFKQVKEYILTNNASEIEIADHFGIELSVVKRWIREGHLEYRNKRP